MIVLIAIGLAIAAVGFAVLGDKRYFGAVRKPTEHERIFELMASLTDAAAAISAAATSLKTAADTLSADAGQIAAPNLAALDQPLADLATSVEAVQAAATTIDDAVKALPPAA